MNITEWVMAGEKKGKSRMYSLFTFFRVESTYDLDITAEEMKKHFKMSDFNGVYLYIPSFLCTCCDAISNTKSQQMKYVCM